MRGLLDTARPPSAVRVLYGLVGLLAAGVLALGALVGREVIVLTRPEPRATLWHACQVHHMASRIAQETRFSALLADGAGGSSAVVQLELLLAQIDALDGYAPAELGGTRWAAPHAALDRLKDVAKQALDDLQSGQLEPVAALSRTAAALDAQVPLMRQLTIDADSALSQHLEEQQSELARFFNGMLGALLLLAAVLIHLRLRMRALHSLQAELQEKRCLADEANLAKSRFLAAASHELRQPVHALNLYVNMLAGDPALPDDARVLLRNAQLCGQAADEMFRTLLDWSRLDAATWPVEIEEFAIGPLLEGASLQFEPQARLKGLQLRVHDTPAWARSEPRMVERIVYNFVSNAVRHSSNGKIIVCCRRQPGGLLRIAVYDSGPGIRPEQHEAIFREFFQLKDTDHSTGKGLGLGLAIAKRLADLLNIPIVLRSTPGHGSMFAIDLPEVVLETPAAAALVPDASPAIVDPGAAASGTHPALVGMLVLVLDNEVTICKAMEHLLSQWGCDVVTAVEPHEAVLKLSHRQRAPGLLICDYWLHGDSTGLATARTLCAEYDVDIPTLLITGDTSPARLREIRNSGTPVLLKPFTARELREALLRLCNPSTA